jgi:hypothetical protein
MACPQAAQHTAVFLGKKATGLCPFMSKNHLTQPDPLG